MKAPLDPLCRLATDGIGIGHEEMVGIVGNVCLGEEAAPIGSRRAEVNRRVGEFPEMVLDQLEVGIVVNHSQGITTGILEKRPDVL